MTQTTPRKRARLLRLGCARTLTRSVRTGGLMEPLNPSLHWEMG